MENISEEILEQIPIIQNCSFLLGQFVGLGIAAKLILEESAKEWKQGNDQRAQSLRAASKAILHEQERKRKHYDDKVRKDRDAAYARVENLLKEAFDSRSE